MSPARGRVLAVVPAWNEAGNLPRLLGELAARRPPPDVLVVDDGSTDGTADVARAHGARVLRLPYNCGIGATVQAGVAWALERDYELVVRFDGDGQHDPAELDTLAEPLLGGAADFVVGSRYLAREGFQSTALRRAGSRWFGLLLRVLCGLKITDPTSGSWAASRPALAVLRAELASDYPEVDSLV
ncbi:MAG: glycosyltransferase family 2 protein, partial [Deltaproteobacteria bacterium]|nr:glycosyltransferase family 2 protein [Deltaproteobacteria bacterium]